MYIFSHIEAYSRIFSFSPPKNRMCPNMPRIPTQIRTRVWEQNFTLFEKIHSFSYSLHVGMILVIYSYDIQKTSNIEYFALFSRIFNINTPPVQNSKIFENSYSDILELVSYSAYSPGLARPQNMQNMQ